METTKKKLYPELPLEDLTPEVAPLCAPLLPSKTNDSPPSSPSGNSSCPTNEPTEKASACPVHKHYCGFLEDFLKNIEEIIDKLEKIKIRAADHHYKSNCAKVSSTVVCSTGVALVMGSLWWAPVTAGSSLVLGAGGAVMSVTGSLTNIVTDYIDYKTTAILMSDIKLLLKQKEVFDEWLSKSLDHFYECLKHLTENGVNEDTAIFAIFEGISKGIIDIMDKPDHQVLSTLTKVVKLHHAEHIVAETLPVVGKTCHISEKSFQFIYHMMGLSGRTMPTIVRSLARICGLFTMGFVLADLTILIRDLCSEHPSVKIIDTVVKKLKEESDVIKHFVYVLKEIEIGEYSLIDKAVLDIKMIVDKHDLLKDFVIVNDDEFHETAGIPA